MKKTVQQTVKKTWQFVQEAKEELQKVTWPTRDEVTSFTMVVIVTLAVLSFFLWAVDTALLALVKVLIS